MRICDFAAAALLIAATLCAAPAMAHPHMFVDARARLVVDDAGRLTALRSMLVIDPLTTLFVLEDYDLDPDAPVLTDAQGAQVAENMVTGLSDYDYFTELTIDGAPVGFASATVTDVALSDGKLTATLVLTLAEPLEIAGRSFELALFDPTYYAAVETLGAPLLPETLSGCSTELRDFEPQSMDSATLAELSQLDRDETPPDPRIGARFADRSLITCAD